MKRHLLTLLNPQKEAFAKLESSFLKSRKLLFYHNKYLNNILLPIQAPTNMKIPNTHPWSEKDGMALK